MTKPIYEITDPVRIKKIYRIIDSGTDTDRVCRMRTLNGAGYFTFWISEKIFFIGRFWGRRIATYEGLKIVENWARFLGCNTLGTNPQGVGKILVRRFGFKTIGYWAYKKVD